MKQFVTIRDVARESGLSYSTVSLVLNNKAEKYHLRPETVEKVLAAAARLGYVRNATADLLRSGTRQRLIGLVVPALGAAIYSEVYQGLSETLNAEGYFLAVCGSAGCLQNEAQCLAEFVSRRLAGAIIQTPCFEAERYELLGKLDIPLIFMQDGPPARHFHSIAFDEEAAGYLAARHLIERGHRHLACLHYGVDPMQPFFQEIWRRRGEGAQRAVAEVAGASLSAAQFSGDFCGPLEAWLAEHCNGSQPAVTGLICHHDLLALGALRALERLGRRIPQDVAVVGCGDLEFCAHASPALTTVQMPRHELGRELGRTMLRLLGEPPEQRASATPCHQLLAPTLIERESS